MIWNIRLILIITIVLLRNIKIMNPYVDLYLDMLVLI